MAASAAIIIAIIGIISSISYGSEVESKETPSNKYGFYCVDGIGDWEGIDVEEESNKYPFGTNYRISNSISPSNIYDTYNADECRRIRRPWNALTTDERHLYIDGLLQLRVNGELDMDTDELVAVASVHDNIFGSVTHHDSDYLFWHSYLVWELESRIRNLGGKYKCFGMPYWDFTDEEAHIFSTGLGGYGDPNNYWKVNGYSWDISTDEYWSPLQKDAECKAEGDECPVCSMKRNGEHTEENPNSAQENGAGIMENNNFIDFQRWIVNECGLPHSIDNSYDPIWYLFHSMESYYQSMWVNCNDYDLIDADDLYKYGDAFSEYCDAHVDHMNVEKCVGIGLEDPLYFGGVLAKRPWSFIHNEKLNIKKLYYLPKWNIIYDLNGDEFFTKSGLQEKCKHKLNSEWFIFPRMDEDESEVLMNKFKVINMENVSFHIFMLIIAVVFIFGLFILKMFCKKKSKVYDSQYVGGYGSI